MTDTDQRKRTVAWWMVAVCSVIVALQIINLIFVAPKPVKAVLYQVRDTAGAVPELCPGETLVFDIEIISNDVPVTIQAVANWCERATGVCLRSLTTEDLVGMDSAFSYSGTISRTIPASDVWVPGRLYEFRNTAQRLDGSRPSIYSVPFTIRENCP